MDASAPRDAASQTPAGGFGGDPAASADPISRLAAEVERTLSRPGGAQKDETERLLEETWSLFTECLVIRDGLLEACQEIERTMGGLQERIRALPVEGTSNGHASATTLALSGGPDGLLTSNGNGNGAHSSSNGAAANGNSNGSLGG